MDNKSKVYVAGHKGLLGSCIHSKLATLDFQNLVFRTHSELDLTNQAAVNDFFRQEKPEYVFLSAGVNGGIKANIEHPADFFHINIAIQDNIFDAAVKTNVHRVIFYGSSCMYPKNCPQPMSEKSLLTGEIEPTSEAYALAKLAGIIACRSYNRQHKNGRFIALVPNSMFGPYDNFDPNNAHVISALIRKIHAAKEKGEQIVTLWGTGKPRRELVFVDDVAEASIFAMQQNGRLENSHYNIGSGNDTSIKDLAELIAKIIKFKGEILWDTTKPDGAARKLLDSSKFRQLGWSPKTTLAAGIEKTYQWYQNNNNNKENGNEKE